ncbi:MAG: alanyl-tRNA editing protein [Hyphomicrobiaceae bacterium]|nr:MAG: alanyl-tRNA editing protein [Hyphomicrobiaceae bacterium]
MTEQLYRTDAYLRDCSARVLGLNERGGIILDRTVFYAAAGGQPGDQGALQLAGGGACPIATTVYDADKVTIVHVPAEGSVLPAAGQTVQAVLDWDARLRLMRMHTCLHLLCSLVKFPVTGGQVGTEEGRLDFDIEDASAVDRDKLTTDLNALIGANHPVGERWITDAELAANPGLVRTMAVKPPMGTGRVRLVAIGTDGAIDLQPCGGTHVRATGEIGPVAVTKIEKKGKMNRRIRVAFA